MSLARDALATLEAAVAVLQRGAALPAEPASAKAVRALVAQDKAPAPPPEAALAALRRSLVALAGEGRGYGAVPTREMRHAPWLLWEQQEPLAALPGLLDDLLSRAAQRKSLLRALLEAWLMGFAAGASMIREAAVALRRLVSTHTHPSMQAWARIDRETRLFDVDDGPRALARWLLASEEPIDVLLSRVGFDDPLRATSGYMRATQAEILTLAPERLASRAGAQAAERVFVFLAPGGRLRFHETQAAGAVARALLSPWIKGSTAASEEVRGAVLEFLVARLGDPRLRPQLWTDAGDAATALIRFWLTKASLDAFFRLIREHALDAHWTYREAFWGAYLKAGVITDAWLAFAPTIHADARSVKELRGAFGRLEGYGVQPNHSVLLMRIGDLIVCEWSHNGSLRAWPADWKTAPRLTLVHYLRKDLMATCLPFPTNARGKGGNLDGSGLRHMSSNSGHWQGSVAELIARRTRVRLKQSDYMPK